jgi:hypothetical protein
MEAINTKLKVRYYIGKSIKLTYNSKISQTNEIHGVINAVTKDNVCLIDFDKREHIIKKQHNCNNEVKLNEQAYENLTK